MIAFNFELKSNIKDCLDGNVPMHKFGYFCSFLYISEKFEHDMCI